MSLFDQLRQVYQARRKDLKERFDRHVSFGDLLSDRWELAQFLGFGAGSSCYDNVLVLGAVVVGRDCWIGPNVILDGRGGLTIGDNVTVSAGAQLYSHSTVRRTVSGGTAPEERAPTRIGSNVYIGPQAVVTMGVTIGDGAVIGAMSLVDRNIPAGMKAWGVPARPQGAVDVG